MKKFDELVEDYSTTPVPDGKTVSGLKVALVVIGTSIALPGFLMGAKIGTSLGLTNAILAFLAGGAVLMFLGSLTAMVASKARLTTYMLVQFAFGPVGGKFVNVVLAFTMFGWFGVNAFMFSKACQSMVANLTGYSGATSLYIVIGSALMVATTIFGFKSLSKLTLYAVPLLACILGAVVTLSYLKVGSAIFSALPHQPMPFGLAVSAIAGGNMVMVAAMPDLARFTANKRQAVWAMFLSYIIGMPFILTSAAIPSLATGEVDLLKIIMSFGLGVPALLVLVLSTWTCNGSNLYGSGLGLAATFKSVPQWKLIIFSGIMGSIFAMAGIVDHFISFLLFLGVIIPPIAGIYVAFYVLYPNKMKDVSQIATLPGISIPAFTAWGLGLAAAAATANDLVTLTTIPSLDALIISMAVYIPMERMMNLRRITCLARLKEVPPGI